MVFGMSLLGVLLFVGLLSLSLRTPVDREVRRAITSGHTGALLEAILQRPSVNQPNLFNRAINLLWSSHHRDLALELIEVLASRHKDEKIAQYWLGQSLSVEPSLTRARLSESFLENHFKPEVAARCGSSG